ncbi:MAG: TIGR00730 family Rossman fold protein [Nitrospinae bacterium]|nr:TIGR00730 family Rossman fold protein [Nitrospinota bacterium]
MTIRSVCVYLASSDAAPESMKSLAREVGEGIARRGWRLVYGGASVGLMGEMANAALAAGGEVLGVIPQHLYLAEVAHETLPGLVVTRDMHERKKVMFDESDAFVALPGGLGTLEELLEVMAWKYLGLHIHPVVILNHQGYYDHLLAQFELGGRQGLMRPGIEKLWTVATTAEQMFSLLAARR